MENLRELSASCCLRLAGSIRKENVGNLDTKLVVAVQNLEDALSFRDQTVTMYENSIDIEGKCHVLCCGRLHR